MKILIATGIFPPEIGGPAAYVSNLAAKLAGAGWDVIVLTYSSSASCHSDASYPFKVVRIVRGNRVLNRVRFFIATLRLAYGRDLIYTLDWFAAGLPVGCAAKVLGKPYVVRVGGDYLWEQRYLESGNTPLSLADFYTNGLHKKYPILFRVIAWVLSNARHVAFNSDKQRELYEKNYQLSGTSTIYNAVPREEMADVVRGKPTSEFVFWGRFIVAKNLDTLVRAFAQAQLQNSYTLTLIGDGPQKRSLVKLIRELHLEGRVRVLPGLPPGEVLERVKDARAFILSSWTDISPNQVYESLAIGLPTLVTKENYLSIHDQLPEMLDPRSVEDVSAKLEMLADDAQYADFAARFRAISFNHDWDAVLHDHLAIFDRVLKEKV